MKRLPTTLLVLALLLEAGQPPGLAALPDAVDQNAAAPRDVFGTIVDLFNPLRLAGLPP